MTDSLSRESGCENILSGCGNILTVLNFMFHSKRFILDLYRQEARLLAAFMNNRNL